jgi:hypothetical protein
MGASMTDEFRFESMHQIIVGYGVEVHELEAEIDTLRAARDALLADLERYVESQWFAKDNVSRAIVRQLEALLAKHRVVSVPPSGGEE